MKKNHKMFMAGFMVCLLLSVVIITAAEPLDLEAKAVLSNSIKLKLFGKDFTPKENDGTYIKPLVYNGKTYLPVRALADALGVAVEYDASTKTVWLGGRTQVTPVNEASMYEDYSRTILTTDIQSLSTAAATYKWGITNNKPMSSVYFGCYLKPAGKYKRFTASVFLDETAKKELAMDFRKNDKEGLVLKSIILKPGETIEVDIDISSLDKLFIFTNVGSAEKIVIGEPSFRNDTVE